MAVILFDVRERESACVLCSVFLVRWFVVCFVTRGLGACGLYNFKKANKASRQHANSNSPNTAGFFNSPKEIENMYHWEERRKRRPAVCECAVPKERRR